MFAVTCPYCQIVNKRGARFCADCGAPLHLKPCPKCGKVDDVTAKKCGACGTAFPPIELAEYRADAEPAAGTGKAPAADAEPPAAPKHAAFKPGPLIVIAIVAGGLPFLWMNRERLMPTPGGLQADPPGRLAVPVAPTPVPPAPLSAPLATPAPPVPAAPAIVAPPPAPVVEPPPPAAVPDKAPAAPAPAATPPSKPKAVAPPARPAAKPEAQKAPETAPAAAPSPTRRECTESLRALGLCDGTEAGR